MEEVLVYVKPICVNADGTNEYDFFFSKTPEIVWGPDWDVSNPSICGDITPDKTTYSDVRRLRSNIRLKTIEEIPCYTMEHAIFGITALSWINLEGLEEYPENGRMVFHFGDTKEKVAELLSLYDLKLS